MKIKWKVAGIMFVWAVVYLFLKTLDMGCFVSPIMIGVGVLGTLAIWDI